MARIYKRELRNGWMWYVDYIAPNGERIRKPVSPRKRDAEEALAIIQAKIVRGEYDMATSERPDDPLFEDFAGRYLQWVKENRAENTYRRRVFSLEVHLIPYFGGCQLSEITPRMIENYKSHRIQKVKKATVNREVCALRNMLRRAVEWGCLKTNPGQYTKLFKEVVQLPRYLTREEAAALLEACPPRIKVFVITALNTGMRKSELLHLQWQDLDFTKRTITVRNRDDFHTKNYEPRIIPMNDALYEALSNHPRLQSSPYVFSNPDGSAFRSIRKSFDRAKQEAGLPDICIHSLRHTFASHLIMAGVDLATVQKLMGHKHITTTMRYAHLAPEYLKAAVQRIGFGEISTT